MTTAHETYKAARDFLLKLRSAGTVGQLGVATRGSRYRSLAPADLADWDVLQYEYGPAWPDHADLPRQFPSMKHVFHSCLRGVARESRGYVYLLARAGVTGTEGGTARPADAVVRTLRDAGAPPTLLGFGIASPEHVRAALDAGADGAISGSAVVRIIEQHQGDEAAMLAHLRDFVQEMKAATRPGAG